MLQLYDFIHLIFASTAIRRNVTIRIAHNLDASHLNH